LASATSPVTQPTTPQEDGFTTPAIPTPLAVEPIDLGKALAAAGIDNPTIALAEEAVRASLANQLRARALWLPSLDAGMNFNWHDGNLQSAQGLIMDVDRQALYVGAGAFAVGAGTVGFPGIRLTAHLADAIFEPVTARQLVAGRQFDALATRNTVLLEVTLRFLDLVSAEARLQAVRQSEKDLGEIVRLTANFARTGQGREGDAERARAQAFLLRDEEMRLQEEVAVTAAELARLLDLNPAIRLRGPGGLLPRIELVNPQEKLESLVQTALANRPEVAARTADIDALRTRLRQERLRPVLPLLWAGFSAGEFGGGSDQADSRFGHFDGRTDIDVMAVWSLRNFGAGDWAVQRRLQAQVNEAVAERVRAIDQIRREVAEARALSLARWQEALLARQRVETAENGFREDLARSRNLQGRPIEVLDSLNLLHSARQDLIRALIGYDQAQFELFVALGQPPN
jgi:outer membrane protein TolC